MAGSSRKPQVMLAKLLQSRHRADPRTGSVPAGQRVYAVGDIHGQLDLLDRLLNLIDADDAARGPASTRLIFLGDLVDRGPDSAGVIRRLRELARIRDIGVLRGNHEEVFLGVLAGDEKAVRLFCRIGGRETAQSYGISPCQYERMDHAELAAALTQRVPAEDRAFLSRSGDMIIVGDYAFVHAGVRPGTPLVEQVPEHLRWIREPFLDHRGPLEKIIVHGHTIEPAVQFRSHRIGIDTGAFATGRLTALGLEGSSAWVLQTVASENSEEGDETLLNGGIFR